MTNIEITKTSDMNTSVNMNTSTNTSYNSDLSAIAKILTNGVIRYYTKQSRDAEVQKTQAFLNSYNNDTQFPKSTGLPSPNK